MKKKYFNITSHPAIKRNSIVFFLIGFFVALFSTIALTSIPLQVEKEYADYCDFPINYCASMNIKTDNSIDEELKGLKSISYKVCKEFELSETNIKLEENNKITIIGVEEGFENYPVLYTDGKDVYLEPYELSSGENFSHVDYVTHSRKAIMNSLFLKQLNLSDNEIVVDGYRISIAGATKPTNYSFRHQYDLNVDIVIYLPMSTFDDIVESRGTMSFSVYDSHNFNLSKYNKYDEFFSSEKYESIVNKEIERRTKNSFLIICSLFAISFVSTSIIQYILLKNKHYEIGIKRAIGASQAQLIYEYLIDFSIFILFGIIVGALLGVSTQLIINMADSIKFRYTMDISNSKVIILSCASFYLISVMFETASLFLGTRINITSTITEER